MEGDYRVLKRGWQAGDRDRQHVLSLMFLAWMHWAEPELLTGLKYDPDAQALWLEIFDHMGGEESSDPEFLFVASIMAGLFPWALGPDEIWEATSERAAARSRLLKPEGFKAQMFENRGDYGDYFRVHTESSRTTHEAP
jgi:hypothetical protein